MFRGEPGVDVGHQHAVGVPKFRGRVTVLPVDDGIAGLVVDATVGDLDDADQGPLPVFGKSAGPRQVQGPLVAVVDE